MSDVYAQAQAEFDQAAVRFTNEKAKLFRADGGAIYADQVYDEKLAALTAELHAVAERLYGVAEREMAEVDRRREAEHDDPIGQLTVQEQQAASGRALFVKEDAMLLSLPDLIKRLRGVNAAGKDKVSAYLWSRYARQRIEAIKTANAESGRKNDPGTVGNLRDLTDAITALEEGLGGKANTPLEKAQASQRIHNARQFQSKLGDRVRDLDGTKERMARAMRNSGLYSL
jgi:G3E family GTPase